MTWFLRFGLVALVACNGQVETAPTSDPGSGSGAPAQGGGGTPGTSSTVTPGAPDDPKTTPGIDPSFCTGGAARMAINGEEVAILDIKGKAIAMNCCDSAKLTIATARFQALFNILWRVSAARPSQTIDVATLTAGPGPGSLELDLGCDPSMTSCASASPEDRFDSGFLGTIEYSPSSSGVDTSYCLSVSEPAGSPHGVLHTVQIYVPHLDSTY